ncbi:MAG: twitching motility protein PilT [Clostridiales bacterium]|nr:twitching motility protein PilT [Clostridiales bacterium]
MIQIIVGEKGKGKSKILIEKANSEIISAKGNIVYLDKSNKHMYELSNRIRLINVRKHLVENQSEFLGFICGIFSRDNDIQSVYLDSFLTIAFVTEDNLKYVLEKMEKISEQYKVDLILSMSMNYNQLPDDAKKYVIEAL